MKKLDLDAERLELAKRIAKHQAPSIHLTTEQLMDTAIKTVQQMTPVEKALLRRKLRKVDAKLLAKTARRLLSADPEILRDMKCDPREN